MGKKLSHSARKFVRLEKARIRATVLDIQKQNELVTLLYKKVLHQPEINDEKTEKVLAPESVATKLEEKKEPKKLATTKIKKPRVRPIK